MDTKALYNLSYGVFILGAKAGNRINACVTNTCMQVANDPVRIAISVLNRNHTCQMIKDSGSFVLSVLDKSVSFETIKRFGFRAGAMLINSRILNIRLMQTVILTLKRKLALLFQQRLCRIKTWARTCFLLQKLLTRKF